MIELVHKKTLSILFGVSLFSVFVFSIGIAGTNSFQEFIKTNTSWFSEKNYALFPLTEVTAATSPVSDAERVQSIVVRFSDGPMPSEFPFTTFSQFQPVNTLEDDIFRMGVYQFGGKPEFILSSLPSKDKIPLYEAIDREYFAKLSPTVRSFTVEIDLLAGDGSLIQTWQYNKCQIIGYGAYLQDIKNFIPFSGQEGEYRDKKEYRDKILFECSGVRLLTEDQTIREPRDPRKYLD